MALGSLVLLPFSTWGHLTECTLSKNSHGIPLATLSQPEGSGRGKPSLNIPAFAVAIEGDSRLTAML